MPAAAMNSAIASVALALLLPVGPLAPQHHADRSDDVGECHHEAGLQVGEAEALDDGGQEEAEAVIAGDRAEIDQRHRQHPAIA